MTIITALVLLALSAWTIFFTARHPGGTSQLDEMEEWDEDRMAV